MWEKIVDPGSFISTLADWTGTISPAFSSELKKLLHWLSLPAEEAVGIYGGV